MRSENAKGLCYAIAAYVAWGLFPLYWKLLSRVSSYEVVAHRIVWSVLFLAFILGLKKRFANLWDILSSKRQLLSVLFSSLLIACNWWVFIWAVQNGFVLEASLGYFICPLTSILMALLFFQEKLNRLQAVSICIALSGVIYLTISYGAVPYVSLALALSFSAYGASKKRSRLMPLESLFMECLVLIPAASAYLLFLHVSDKLYFLSGSAQESFLLLLCGGVTALPLLWFASSLKFLSMTVVGMLQYIGPSLQFILAVLWFKEPFDKQKFYAFLLIWVAIAIFTFDSYQRSKLKRNNNLS